MSTKIFTPFLFILPVVAHRASADSLRWNCTVYHNVAAAVGRVLFRLIFQHRVVHLRHGSILRWLLSAGAVVIMAAIVPLGKRYCVAPILQGTTLHSATANVLLGSIKWASRTMPETVPAVAQVAKSFAVMRTQEVIEDPDASCQNGGRKLGQAFKKCDPKKSKGFLSAHNCKNKGGNYYYCITNAGIFCESVDTAARTKLENGECFL
ncbi:hypothetical protein C8F04DRAFT_1194553 [Mycena alexandri]|uniref:Uncharacterized protein n=1 Tax=Mycena alexandri TaxID=1745969 RepID=A0AAD6WPL7_9AGAR|nr:hypothetical protein C8F04DRAFT_1194553 [Mycena alexandri]